MLYLPPLDDPTVVGLSEPFDTALIVRCKEGRLQETQARSLGNIREVV